LMGDTAAWKPRRKPYVPSWTRGGSNIYREQQNEYTEYAKQHAPAPPAGGKGKGFGGGEATRDPEPSYIDPKDPKAKQAAIHEAESFAEYLAKRSAMAAAAGESAGATTRTVAWAREIEQACAPVHYLCVSDVTDGHATEGAEDGRALSADGRDLKVLVVTDRFIRMSRRARQELVNGVLSDYMRTGAVHSVQMRCWAPQEWVDNGSPMDLGAPCSYSSTGGKQDVELGQSLGLPTCTTAPEDPGQQ